MSDVKINIRPNGPFLVSGQVDLIDPSGGQYDLGGKDTIALCRCGASKNRPFCDGSHKECNFQSEESAPAS